MLRSLIFSSDNVEAVVADGTDQPALFGTTLAIIVQDANNWKVARPMAAPPSSASGNSPPTAKD
jgi:hypothetical protein